MSAAALRLLAASAPEVAKVVEVAKAAEVTQAADRALAEGRLSDPPHRT